MLTKHGIVMNLHPIQQSENFKYFEFSAGPEWPNSRTDGYYMTNQVYEDMGSPQVITVEVRPGDWLSKRPDK